MTYPKLDMLIDANERLVRREEIEAQQYPKDTAEHWLHVFRAQESRQLLTVLLSDPHPCDLDEIGRRTADLIELPYYCGDNHHKHYLAKLAELDLKEPNL